MSLRLEAVSLHNIACFASFELRPDPRCTLLIGGNGVGKTVLLEAISGGLSALFAGMENIGVEMLQPHLRRQVISTTPGGAHILRPTPVAAELRAEIDGAPYQWTIRSRKPSGRAAAQLRPLIEWGRQIEASIGRGEAPTLPVVAFYATDRVWTGRYLPAFTGLPSPQDAWLQALPANRPFREIVTWMRRLAYAEKKGDPSPQLRQLSAGISRAIPEIASLSYDILTEDVIAEFTDGSRRLFNQLSDGYRSQIGLAADLLWRMMILNPHISEAVQDRVGGVVLIDEIDLHLHPAWQRRVLPDLLRAFPLVQFILTTHSPQVIASAQQAWVRAIRPDGAYPVGPVEGRDSNALLIDVFHTPERDPAFSARLHQIAAHLENEDFESARQQIDALEQIWGPNDPQILRLRTTLRLLSA